MKMSELFRKFVAAGVICLLVPYEAVVGVASHQAKFSGGTVTTPAIGATGVFDNAAVEQLSFRYKAGKSKVSGPYPEGTVTIPYADVTRLIYGDVKHLRVGETIALAALAGVGGLLLLLSKSHTHYLAINYKDPKGDEQVVNFEVGKDEIRPLMSSLEVRTGKKIELEAMPSKSKH